MIRITTGALGLVISCGTLAAMFVVLPFITAANTTGELHSEVASAVLDELRILSGQLNQTTRKASAAPAPRSQTVDVNENNADQQLLKVAKRRGVIMRELAKQSPSEFLKNTIPKSVRSKLPVVVQAEVEEQTEKSGTAEVLHYDDFKRSEKSTFSYRLVIGAKREKLYFAGEAPALSSGDTIIVQGYSIGDITVAQARTGVRIITRQTLDSRGIQRTLIIPVTSPVVNNEKPLTRVQLQEMIFKGPFHDYYKEQSYNKVSFSGTVLDWISIPTDDYPIGSCNYRGLDINHPTVLSAINGSGIDLTQYGRVVYIYVDGWSGCGEVGKSIKTIGGVAYNFSQAWSSTSMAPMGNYVLYKDNVARTTPYPSNIEEHSFAHCRIFATNNPTSTVSCTWNGRQIYTSARPTAWVGGLSIFSFVLAHEIGHNLGVRHAGALECTGKNYVQNCYYIKYGNAFDVMGMGLYGIVDNHEFRGGHFNAFYKNYLGWLTGTAVKNTNVSGQSTLSPLETATGTRMLKITNPALPAYPLYVEFRQPVGFDKGLSPTSAGLFINETISAGMTAMLLIANQQRPPNPSVWQPALMPGATFSDPQRGISIVHQGGVQGW